ncbi:MAG: TonB-dependent receptor [Myxococcales bacterium]|nr:TonB-dependent receptor [Myxococcales bacterium]
MRLVARLALLASCLAFATAASAEESAKGGSDASAAADEKRDPIQVEVVGEKADQIQKIPGSFTTITKKEIERARPVDAAEMLRRVPGVLVRQDTSGGLRLDIGIRGLDPGRSRRLLVLEDGVPLAINPYAEPDLYFLPQIERYSKVEVLKGSGSILFGPQTIGGVVNFSTIAPPDRLESRVSVDAGEYGYVRTLGRFGVGIETKKDQEPVRVLGQVVIKRADGARDQPFSDHDAMVKVAFPTGKVGAATLKIAAHRTEAVSEDVGLTRGMFDEDPRRPALSPQSKAFLSRFDASFTHDHYLTPDIVLKKLVYASVTDRAWTRQRYERIPQAGVRYERIAGETDLPLGALYFRDEARVLERTYWVVGLEPRLTAKVRTGAVGHTVDAGFRVLGEGASLDERDTDRKGSTEGTLVAAEGHRTIAFAAYAQDRIAFTDEIVVTPGVRFEHATYDRDVALSPAGVTSTGGSGNNAVVPGLGMTTGVPEVHAFAGMHLGYAPPRATTAISDQGQTQALDAERSTNWELGLRAKPASWQRLEATGFLQRFTNQIVPNTVPGGVTELVNGGATQSLGAELGSETSIGDAVGLGHAIDLGIRGGLLRATFEEGENEGRPLPYAPVYTVSSTLDFDFSFGLGFGAAVTHVGPHYADDASTVLPDASGRVGEIPGYTLLDLAIRYRNEQTGLGTSLQAKNLLDDVFVIARRPEGIQPAGFRQIVASLWWDIRD